MIFLLHSGLNPTKNVGNEQHSPANSWEITAVFVWRQFDSLSQTIFRSWRYLNFEIHMNISRILKEILRHLWSTVVLNPKVFTPKKPVDRYHDTYTYSNSRTRHKDLKKVTICGEECLILDKKIVYCYSIFPWLTYTS